MNTPFGNVIADERVPKDQVWFYSSRRPLEIVINKGPYAGLKMLMEPDYKIVNIGMEPSSEDHLPHPATGSSSGS